MRYPSLLRAPSLMVGAVVLLAACSTTTIDPVEPETSPGANESAEGSADSGVVRVVTHDSFELPEELLEEFTESTGYEIELSAPGDGGALVNQLVLTKDSPLGDAVYGIDNSFAARAMEEEIMADVQFDWPQEVEDYLLPGLVPVDVGDVCLNVDDEWFTEAGQEAPETFADLIDEEYAGLTVLTNPAQSSPGLAFFLATISDSEDWVGYWNDLVDNDTKIVDGWSDAYYTDFSANGGDRPIVLSYSSSPALTLDDDGEATTSSVLETCYRQVEYAGVLQGAQNPEGAQAFLEFLLSEEVQQAIPDAMFMYPVVDVDLPDEWAQNAPLATDPHLLDPTEVQASLDEWLRTWHDDVIG